MVEVDSSYYAIPAPQTAQLWAERTPRDFTFNVKAFRALTGHPFQAKVLPKDLQLALGAGPRKSLLQGFVGGAADSALGFVLRRRRALAAERQTGRDSLPVRAVGYLRGASAQARRTLRADDGRAGLNGGGVSQCLLVDRAQSRLDARVRTRARLGQRCGRWAAGIRNQRAGGVGSHISRTGDRAHARAQRRHVGQRRVLHHRVNASTTTTPKPSSPKSRTRSRPSRARCPSPMWS